MRELNTERGWRRIPRRVGVGVVVYQRRRRGEAGGASWKTAGGPVGILGGIQGRETPGPLALEGLEVGFDRKGDVEIVGKEFLGGKFA